jgi:hypothetical protein
MQEIWKDIKGYEGLYKVSNLGRVKSLNRVIKNKNGSLRSLEERMLNPLKDTDGYLMVGLFQYGNQKRCKIHRLVAETFLENPNNKPQVNHINEIKSDNKLSNLEWVTAKENVNHGSAPKRRAESRMKRVVQISIEGEEIRTFKSMNEVAECGFTRQSVQKVCKGYRKTHKGFVWRFL